jgi:parvulin-like peptidyl-prolyl isomerase
MVFIIASLLLVAVLAGVGIFYYQTNVAPYRKVVLTVDNQVVRMDYFLKRVRMADDETTQTLQQLTYEQIVKTMAPQYNLTVSPSDVDSALKKEALSSGVDSSSEAAFQGWYAEKLSTTGLSDSEYRDMVESNLLAAKFQEYLSQDIPAKAEQVHLYTILTATSVEAEKARSRIVAGEEFTAVASDISLDTQTKSRGGELGWIPRGVTPYDDVVFNLNIGQISDPVAVDADSPGTSQYSIFKVTEKDPDRTIDAGPMGVLRSRAFYDWMLKQMPQHVKYSYSTDDQIWVYSQLIKNYQTN